MSSQAEDDYRERSQSAPSSVLTNRTVPPPARECSVLRSLSALKGCFLEAELMAVFTPPCHFYTFRLPPCNAFFGETENLLKADHFQDCAGFLCCVVVVVFSFLFTLWDC